MKRIFGTLLLFLLLGSLAAQGGTLEGCLAERGLTRVARVAQPDGPPRYGRVLSDANGVPTRIALLDAAGPDLEGVFEQAHRAHRAEAERVWRIGDEDRARRICAPVSLARAALDAEQQVVVAVGLNYAAHADEAGGGDIFLFPKPVAPTPPYAPLRVPAGVTLLDYEVELGFVLLADVDLRRLPTRDQLLRRIAFFVANDVSDREPIIRHKALRGPGTGFVEGKGQPGFLPLGPWMVRGSELSDALAACGANGLGIRLWVDEGQGFRLRQEASTSQMILDPLELLARLREEVERAGLHSPMPIVRDGRPRHYPLAVDAEAPRLPAGSIVLTGTPDGVALRAPGVLGVTAKALLRLRSPLEQFRRDELARAAAAEPGGYLAPGDRVRASIDGLGAQIFPIVAPDPVAGDDPCEVRSVTREAGGSR